MTERSDKELYEAFAPEVEDVLWDFKPHTLEDVVEKTDLLFTPEAEAELEKLAEITDPKEKTKFVSSLPAVSIDEELAQRILNNLCESGDAEYDWMTSSYILVYRCKYCGARKQTWICPTCGKRS